MIIVLYILAGIFMLFMGLRFYFIFKLKKMKGKDAPNLSGKKGSAIRSGEKALFYFHSPGCGACRAMTPVVKDMGKKNDKVFSVDISQDMETARKFGIMATPSTIIVESGIVIDVIIGPQPGPMLKAIMK
jgi:thioredoxin